jgi:hypothetical protein
MRVSQKVKFKKHKVQGFLLQPLTWKMLGNSTLIPLPFDTVSTKPQTLTPWGKFFYSLLVEVLLNLRFTAVSMSSSPEIHGLQDIPSLTETDGNCYMSDQGYMKGVPISPS